MSTLRVPPPRTLAIALGANKTSRAGAPSSTLIAVRPLLQKVIETWISTYLRKDIEIKNFAKGIYWNWSPLFSTKPIGGPPNQADFINAVVVINGPTMNHLDPSMETILNLLEKVLLIEQDFGRDRTNSSITWGPRTLDIDILAWGQLHVKHKNLILPHPRLIERNFVATPLAAALNKDPNSAPRKLSPQNGWPE